METLFNIMNNPGGGTYTDSNANTYDFSGNSSGAISESDDTTLGDALDAIFSSL